MFAIITVVISSVFLIISWWYFELFKLNKYLSKIPGPTPLPLLGNAHLFGSLADIIPTLIDLGRKHGRIFKIMFLHKARLILHDPKAIEYVLSSPNILKKSYEYNFFRSWLGEGLLTTSGARWRRQRKLITPTFHFQILEQFLEVFDKQSDVFVEKLEKEIDGGPFDIMPYVTLCALDIMCEAAMGTEVNAQRDSKSDYISSVKEMSHAIITRSISSYKMIDFLYAFTKDYQIEKQALETIQNYVTFVIQKRRTELLNNNKQREEDEVGIKKKLTFLDMLLQCKIEGQPLDDVTIRDEVNTFMFEGHDTTSSAVSFALYTIANNEDVQNKIVDELKLIFCEDQKRSPTYKDLQNMKYLEMVIKEVIRLYPPVPLFTRVLEEEVEAFDGLILPKGLSLTISAFGLHRQEDLFPNPEKFDPERFSPENTLGRSPYAYVPFSAGPRNCIGQRFAMLEMKSTISKILRNYQLLPVKGHEPFLTLEIILKSANGLSIQLKKRKF